MGNFANARKCAVAAIAAILATAGLAGLAVAAQGRDNRAGPPPQPRVFRAGAYAMDITPQTLPVIVNGGFQEQTADRVNDPLHARCLVLDDGAARVAIAVVDNCLMPRELLDRAKALAHEATGIRPDRILISATHTHSAPSVVGALGSDADAEYSRFLPGQIARGIELAAKNLAPARVGWAVANAPQYTHCRRWILRPDKVRIDPFGQRTVRAMMHPGYQNPDFVGPAGPVDSGLSILSIQSPGGRPIALLANYSMHYVGAPAVSADYYGRFAAKIAERIGAGEGDPLFVGIMSQGTSGDQQWMDYGRPRQERDIDSYGDALAGVAHEAYRKIQYHDWVPLEMREKKIALGHRLADEKRLAWAREVVAGMQERKPRTQPEIYAREQLLLAEQPTREVTLQAIRIGELGIAAVSCEVFGITGLKIKAQSPLVPTFTVELANGSDGYIPPPEQHKLGGYTTWAARTAGLEVNAEPRIVNAVLGLLEDVSGQPRRPVLEPDSPYTRAVLASKPLAYWRLGECSGPDAVDASGQGKHGEYEDGVAFYLDGPALSNPSGQPSLPSLQIDPSNRAAHFAGGRMKAAVETMGNPYSVELWFYNALPVDARAVTGYLFSRGADGAPDAPGDHLGIGGQHAATGRLLFFNGNALNQTLAGKSTIRLNTWNHVVLVREGDKVAVYLNGDVTPEIAGEAAVGFPAVINQLFIGGRNDNFANFEGRIDEAAVYDRALPPEEIAGHYKAAP